MNFEEFVAKPLLAREGIAIPRSEVVTTASEAIQASARLGEVVIKAQVPAGKRGKSGGVKVATDPKTVAKISAQMLEMTIEGHSVKRLLIEERVDISIELYAAVITDTHSKGPLMLFSTQGGIDIEQAAATDAISLRRMPVDIRTGFELSQAIELLDDLSLQGAKPAVADVLVKLYRVWRSQDAELLEINPLAVTNSGKVVALDCKFTLDDLSKPRNSDLAMLGTPDKFTALEEQAHNLGLTFIELNGNIGIIANGAGLTMTTMDAIKHYGGDPANFMEIGGQSYTKAIPAIDIVISNPNVKALVVNFCGAFARTDIMTEGVINAWEKLKPKIPIFFSIHGTGSKVAIPMVRNRLGFEPFETMDDAVKAAILATR